MRVLVNGKPVELQEGACVRDAANAVGVEPTARGVAVALDGEVVPRSMIDSRTLSDGQRLEIVSAIQGGC
jgi:sulfur carrier protein